MKQQKEEDKQANQCPQKREPTSDKAKRLFAAHDRTVQKGDDS